MPKAVVIGVTIFAVLLAAGLWLANSLGLIPGYVVLRTYMDDASGLTDGTKVRVNGIPIGYLDHQRLTGSRDRNRSVEFELKVRTRFLEKIPVDSTVRVVADNLLSDKAINIVPGNSPQHVTAGAELVSALAVDPNKMMAQMGNTLQQFQEVVNRANTLLATVDQGDGNIGKMKSGWDENWSRIPRQAEAIAKDWSRSRGTANRLLVDNSEFMNEMQATRKRFNDVAASFQSGQGTAAKIPEARKEFDETSRQIEELQRAIRTRSATVDQVQLRIDNLMARFNAVADRINAGQGTLGQFAVNPQFSAALAGTGREFQALAKDLRANPRKFLSVRVALF